MTLREKLVEAGAEALRDAYYSPPVGAASAELTEAVLDALLDCLAENADEWVSAVAGNELDDAMERGDRKLAGVLLAALEEPADG